MNQNYMLGSNDNNITFFTSPNLSITIKPIDCPNNTNEIEFCEIYSFIEIRNTETRIQV